MSHRRRDLQAARVAFLLTRPDLVRDGERRIEVVLLALQRAGLATAHDDWYSVDGHGLLRDARAHG